MLINWQNICLGLGVRHSLVTANPARLAGAFTLRQKLVGQLISDGPRRGDVELSKRHQFGQDAAILAHVETARAGQHRL